jgi:RHS repeat-associated protein
MMNRYEAGNHRLIWCALLIGTLASAAHAELPSVKWQTAPLVTPTQAWTYFGTNSTHTIGVAATAAVAPEIVELSNALSQGGTCINACYASLVYQYVRNNIAMEFRFGLGKGGRGALVDQSGTPFDQAQLMVMLLRQAGIAASYQVGTITLNGTQFQQWTGISNAAGACQYLADGGIPATVNTLTSCTSLTVGTPVSSIVMGHIWISALGKLYDPSYKIHIVKPGIGSTALAGALGCSVTSCASGVVGHVPGPVASPIPSVNQIQNVDQTGLEQQITTYATNLENYVRTQNGNNYTTLNPNMQVEDLLGGIVIDESQPLPPQSATTFSTLPASAYSANSSYLWTGDVPDVFRTTLTVIFTSINQLLYADETAGNRLRLINNGRIGLYSEYMLLASGYLNPGQTDAPLTLNVTHPYATSTAAHYLTESLTYNVHAAATFNTFYYVNQVTIIQGWGNASESTVAHFSALVMRDQTHTPPETLSPQNPSLTSSNQVWLDPLPSNNGFCGAYPPATTAVATTGCFELEQGIYAANWLAESARAVTLAAAVNGTVGQLHHSLGIVVSGQVPAPALVISAQSSMSVNINTSTGTQSDRTAAFFGSAAVLSRLEGGVIEQAGDSWEGGSSVSLMTKSNLKTSANPNAVAFYDVTPQNVAATVGNSNLSSYGSFYTQEIKPYVDAGGEVILPQQAGAGSFCVSNVCYAPGFNGFVAFGANADRITYGTNTDSFDKGAGGENNPTGIITQQTTIQNYSVRKRTFLTVDPSRGSVNLAPPPDLVTGTGDFPMSLEFQRVYSSAAIGYQCGNSSQPYRPCMRTTAEISGLPNGWTHTLAVTARLTSDGFASLGRNSALDASAVVAALFTARQLNTGARSFQSNVATIFVINWLGAQLNGNVVVVRRPPHLTAFVRMPDNSFNPPPGESETLTQTGTRQFIPEGPSVANWDNSQLAFALRTQRGETLTFQYASYQSTAAPPVHIPALYHATSWTFPTGISLSFAYGADSNGLESAACLIGVSNNLGRSLSFTDMCPIHQNVDPMPTPPSILKVKDDAGRSASVAPIPSSLSGSNVCDSGCIPYMVSDLIAVTGLLVVAPDGVSTSEYDYVPRPSTVINRPYYQIYQWLTPDDRINAYQTVSFDSLFRANSVKDNSSGTCCSTRYWVSGLYGTEFQKMENVVDPLGAIETKYLDRWNSLLQEIDPLGRITSNIYDSARHRIQTTFPELNYDSYTYDVRGNKLSTTHHVKPGSTLAAPPPELISYMEIPTKWPCAWPATCNLPKTTTDANLNVTTYDYLNENTVSGTGQLQRITNAAVTAQTGGISGSAQTDYCYQGYAGTSGTVSLLSASIQKVDSTTNRVKSFLYNGGNKLTLQTAIVDPATIYIPPATAGGACATNGTKSGALGLTTGFTFDAVGNVNTIDGPIAGTVDTTTYLFDSARRLTTVSAPLSALTRYCYDADGQLLSTNRARSATTDPNAMTASGLTSTGQCPANSYPTATWQTESRTYFAPGYLRSVTDAQLNTTLYAYDPDGRQQVVQDPDGRQVATVYDLAGETLATWKGGSSWITTDGNQNPSSAALALANTNWIPSSYGGSGSLRYASYLYSLNGKQISIQDADNNTTQLQYDGLDRLRLTLFADPTAGTLCSFQVSPTSNYDSGAPTCSGSQTYELSTYDSNGNRLSLRSRKGDPMGYHFDALNRQDIKTPAGLGAVTTGFNLLGEPLLVSEAAGGTHGAHTTQYAYDGNGRKTSETDDGRQILYQYDTLVTANDSAGNRTRTTWPDGYFVSYQYDALNRMLYARENSTSANELAFYTYDSLSRRQALRLGGQTSNAVGYAYETDSDLSSLTHTLNTISVTLGYTHNNSHQMKTLNASDSFYLPTPASASSTAYVPNALNEYGSVGGQAVTNDLNGSLKTWTSPSTGATIYTYDSENRLVSAATNGSSTASITYDYDGLGRRASKSVSGVSTTYLLDGDEEIAEYSGTTILRRYVTGTAIDDRIAHLEIVAGTPYRTYYHVNHEGSVMAMTDASGNVSSCATNVLCQRLAYDEYGNLATGVSGTGEPFQYAGRRFDPESGLYYYRARYYSPQLGRFLQTDPVGYKDDLNLYAYVGNDPLDKTDPTGTLCDKAGTFCTADTYKPLVRARVDVTHETNMDAAVVAHAGDYQKPTKQGGEPTGTGMSNGTESGGGGTVTRTDSRPGETSTARTAALSPKDVWGKDAVVHGHLDGKVTDEPTANKGYGDTQSLKLGVPTYTVEGKRVGVHDAPGGQLRFQMIKGVMTPTEMKDVQRNLNREQELFNK